MNDASDKNEIAAFLMGERIGKVFFRLSECSTDEAQEEITRDDVKDAIRITRCHGLDEVTDDDGDDVNRGKKKKEIKNLTDKRI